MNKSGRATRIVSEVSRRRLAFQATWRPPLPAGMARHRNEGQAAVAEQVALAEMVSHRSPLPSTAR